MIKTIAIFLALSSSCLAFDIRQRDKQIHLAGSAVMTFVGYHLLRDMGFDKLPAQMLAGLGTFTLGHLKETTDPFFDPEDMQADAVGIGLGLVLTF